jgi:hypothetical protein
VFLAWTGETLSWRLGATRVKPKMVRFGSMNTLKLKPLFSMYYIRAIF